MQAIADTERLVADGVITPDQAQVIEGRAKETMTFLAINSVLCFGIIAATAGLIFWLANAVLVAVFGALALIGGLLILARTGDLYRMFGNAAALIGAGMLLGGATTELLTNYEQSAGWVMLFLGAAIGLGFALLAQRRRFGAPFVTGAIFLMGLAMHLGGLGYLLGQAQISGPPISLAYAYAACLIAVAGWLTDIRFVTVLAIVPFAQMLDTGTFYFHAMYAFYSPEPTLSVLQMTVLVVACLLAVRALKQRDARHLHVLAVLAFIVANLCALVGSLWGDVVGETLWGPGYWTNNATTWEEHDAAREAFRRSAVVISEGVYSVLWAIVLAGVILWSAVRGQRGLFNTAMTFAAIHAYTQLFESFGQEPLAYVLGGLAAIPLAWGMWRLNDWIATPR